MEGDGLSIEVESASKALNFITQIGWPFQNTGDQANVQTCPFCHNTNAKFYINITGGSSDGLWDCKVCSRTGNLFQLKQEVGHSEPNIVSLQDAILSKTAPSPLPNFDLFNKGALRGTQRSVAELRVRTHWLSLSSETRMVMVNSEAGGLLSSRE